MQKLSDIDLPCFILSLSFARFWVLMHMLGKGQVRHGNVEGRLIRPVLRCSVDVSAGSGSAVQPLFLFPYCRRSRLHCPLEEGVEAEMGHRLHFPCWYRHRHLLLAFQPEEAAGVEVEVWTFCRLDGELSPSWAASPSPWPLPLRLRLRVDWRHRPTEKSQAQRRASSSDIFKSASGASDDSALPFGFSVLRFSRCLYLAAALSKKDLQ